MGGGGEYNFNFSFSWNINYKEGRYLNEVVKMESYF